MEIKQISVIGSGAMGSGIAQVAAQNDYKVAVYDVNPVALQNAAAKLSDTLEKLQAKGKFSPEKVAQIKQNILWSNKLSEVAKGQLIIEAIVEDLSSKQLLYREIELLAPENTIFASNTSSLSIAALASVLKNPANFVGLHFFNPVPLMKLVEIIPALQTHPSLIATLQKLMQDWGKVPVLAKDTPGFIVNKVARPFYGEALRIYEEGIASFAEIDYSMKNYGGFRMGPFELMDFIGNDINYAVTESVFLAFYFDPRYKPAFAQKKMVDANWLGRKTAKGYYTYPLENEATPAILPDETKAKAIFERVLAMLINEAADTLFWQIATAEDIDTAMRYGTNYPKGLLQWANDWGIANVVSYMDNLYETYREDRYRCSPLLRKMASENKLFFQA